LSSRHQKGKRAISEEATPLLIVCRLLVVIGLIIIIIIIIVANTSRTNIKGSQLSWRQRVIRVGDGWVDRDVKELKERLIPLTVDNLLVASNYLKALVYHIQALVCAMTHGKDTFEHLQDTGVGAIGEGGTTAAGSAGRSNSWSRRAGTMSPRIFGHCGANRLICYILIELLTNHHLNHVLNIWCKLT
jgi:hypothetical protein